jgi:hypothetical protein
MTTIALNKLNMGFTNSRQRIILQTRRPPKNAPNLVKKSARKVIGCETKAKTGEMSKMGSKKTAKTANPKNPARQKKEKDLPWY